MSIQEAAILLGCHGFDDFPVHHAGDDAQSLLCSWTALWHPQLIAAHGKIPSCLRVDDPPEQREGQLWVVPTPYADQLHPQVLSEIESKGGLVIRSATTRDAILAPALTAMNVDPGSRPTLTDDFFALGYAYLQVELLTRQMRYSTSVEETMFEQSMLEAAQSSLAGDETATREKLQACFDFLAQERDHYYAVDVFLIDLTMVARQVLDNVAAEVATSSKSNLLMSGEVLKALEAEVPESHRRLKEAIQNEKAGIIGGEFNELPLSLLATETIRTQVELGTREFTSSLGQSPTVFGRRQFGLSPCLPQLLGKFGFRGALHATFDGGQFPQATQSKSRWEGDGQTSLDAIVRAPLDASQTTTFLNLAGSISESMDMDHVATRCFVHWAGVASPWYRELQRVTQYTSALGRFVTVDEYFDETYDPGMHDRFTADQYRSPRLQDSVNDNDAHPISASVNYWRHQLLMQSLLSCRAMHVVVDSNTDTVERYRESLELQAQFATSPFEPIWQQREPELEEALQQCGKELAIAVTRSNQASNTDGLAVINPMGYARRIAVLDATLPSLPEVKNPVYAASGADKQQLMVDTPGWGGSFLRGSTKPVSGRSRSPDLAEEGVLRNEFLEAKIDEKTGALRSLRDYSNRGNRLSQQLAFRNGQTRDADAAQQYTSMVADSVQVVTANAAVGEIVSKGRLVNSGNHTVAKFEQTYRVLRGSRVLEIAIRLDPAREPEADPWNSYYGCRFAWSNEASDLARALNDIRRSTSAKRFEAPLFIQIDDGEQRTAILTGGLPYHRRIGRRMLDSLLIVRGEEQREFRIGIGLDLKQPFREAQSLISPQIVVPRIPVGAESSSSWLFHIDAPNVLLTGWEVLLDGNHVIGVKMRVSEVDGRPGGVCIRSFRPFESARKTDFLGQTVTQCEVEGDQIRFQISAHELVEIEALYAS